MPELPEVETIARGVHARVCGDRIVDVWFGTHREPFKTSRARQARGLEGRLLLAVHRTGKHIVCELGPAQGTSNSSLDTLRKANKAALPSTSPEAEWIVHLGMTGRLLVTTPEAPVAAHTHARLGLASGRELRFVDPRRFGRLEFRSLDRDEAFAASGAEPLTISPEEFAALFRGRRLPIKAALLNQTLLSGVGNIYADESLFHAGRDGWRAASPRPNLNGSGSPCARFLSMRSGWAVRPFPTTWMPTGCVASSNWNTASICAPACPAAVARPRFGAFCWPGAGLISAPIASDKNLPLWFFELLAFQPSKIETIVAVVPAQIYENKRHS
jgi:DNA-formamidopyrimidine glycosylase